MLSSLPADVLSLILEYAPAHVLPYLRQLCVVVRDILDDEDNVAWKSIYEKYSKSTYGLRVLYGKSIGVSALMVRASGRQNACVCCRLWFNLERHRFFDVILCQRCVKNNVFRTISLRKACQYFFLNYRLQKENGMLLQIKKGRSQHVLYEHVRDTALKKYPNGELQDKITKRFERSLKTDIRKRDEKIKRIRDISEKYIDFLWESPSRIDPVLRDQEVLKDLVAKMGSSREVFGDTLDSLVKAYTKTTTVARRLFDYASMLTYMRKVNLLNFGYDISPDTRCHPHQIFRHHVNGGLHFYELCQQYADEMNQLLKRSTEVDMHILQNTLTSHHRETLAVALCAEEGVSYRVQDFYNFVATGEASGEQHPVAIARRIRRNEFLNQNHYQWELQSFVNMGTYSVETARKLAEKNVMQRTKGYPPMMRVCYINLGVPNLQRGRVTSSLSPPWP